MNIVEIAVRRQNCDANGLSGTRQTGQAIVELTLLLPLVVLVFLAGADFARLFYHSSALAQAARSGVQYGAQNLGTSADIAGMAQTAVNSASADLNLQLSDVTPAPRRYFQCANDTPTATEVPCADGNASKVFVEVSVQKTFTTLFDYPGIPHTVAVSRVATMRVR